MGVGGQENGQQNFDAKAQHLDIDQFSLKLGKQIFSLMSTTTKRFSSIGKKVGRRYTLMLMHTMVIVNYL